MYWIGLQPGDMHLNISSPGWAKHAWSCFFAPWNAGATVFIYNQPRFYARGPARRHGAVQVTTLCAPPTVWRMLIQEDLQALARCAARGLVGAGEPLNPEVIEQVQSGVGPDRSATATARPRRPRRSAIRPGQPLKPGSMGRPLPGYRVVLLDPDGSAAEEGEICTRPRRRGRSA